MLDASITSEPSDSTFTRGAVWPRITGRLAPPPKVSLLTPGRFFSVSPSVPLRCSISASPSSTEAGKVVLFRSSPSGLAETVIGASVLAAERSAAASAASSACAAGAASISAQTRGFSAPRRPARRATLPPRSLCHPSFLPFIIALFQML